MRRPPNPSFSKQEKVPLCSWHPLGWKLVQVALSPCLVFPTPCCYHSPLQVFNQRVPAARAWNFWPLAGTQARLSLKADCWMPHCHGEYWSLSLLARCLEGSWLKQLSIRRFPIALTFWGPFFLWIQRGESWSFNSGAQLQLGCSTSTWVFNFNLGAQSPRYKKWLPQKISWGIIFGASAEISHISHLLFARPFFLSFCLSTPGNVPLSWTSELLFLVEQGEPSWAGFWRLVWTGSPHRKRGISLKNGTQKKVSKTSLSWQFRQHPEIRHGRASTNSLWDFGKELRELLGRGLSLTRALEFHSGLARAASMCHRCIIAVGLAPRSTGPGNAKIFPRGMPLATWPWWHRVLKEHRLGQFFWTLASQRERSFIPLQHPYLNPATVCHGKLLWWMQQRALPNHSTSYYFLLDVLPQAQTPSLCTFPASLSLIQLLAAALLADACCHWSAVMEAAGDRRREEEEEQEEKEDTKEEGEEKKKEEDKDEDKVLNMEAIAKACCCPICFETFNALDKEPVGTPCCHWFCRSCVNVCLPAHHWLCPICRQPAPRDSLRHDLWVRDLVSERSVRCRNHSAGCEWAGSSRSRKLHEQSCLVNRVLQLQQQLDEARDANQDCHTRIANLSAALRKKAQQGFAMRREIDRMREQAEVDKATIESLRTDQGGLENQVAEQDSRTICGRAGLRSHAPDTDEWNLLRSGSCAQAPWHVMSSAGEASHEPDFLEAKGEEWQFTHEERDMKEDGMDTTKEPWPQWIERHCAGVLQRGTVKEKDIRHSTQQWKW